MGNSNFRHDVFDPAVTRAGLAPLTPHDLCDTAASLAISAGANIKTIQRMLGHASAAMTLDIYAGLFDDDLDRVGERLSDAADAHLGAADRTDGADSVRTDEGEEGSMILLTEALNSTQGPDLEGRPLCSVSTRRALGRTRTCNLLIRSHLSCL